MEAPWLLWMMLWTLFGNASPDAGRDVPEPLAIRVPLRQGLPSEAQPAAKQRAPGASRRRRSAEGISFVDMIDNLRGKSGQGYYVEMAVGTPPQKVRSSPSTLCSGVLAAPAPKTLS